MTKDERASQFQNIKRILDINPYHPFIKELLERVKNGPDEETEESARLLYQVSLLQAGFDLKDSQAFSGNFYKLMKDSFGISRDVDKVELDLTEFEEEETKEVGEIAEGENENIDLQND